MVQGATIIDDWIAEGEARGEARGRAEEARRSVLGVLCSRFGDPSPSLVSRIKQADAEWCRTLFDRALEVESLDDLVGA